MRYRHLILKHANTVYKISQTPFNKAMQREREKKGWGKKFAHNFKRTREVRNTTYVGKVWEGDYTGEEGR